MVLMFDGTRSVDDGRKATSDGARLLGESLDTKPHDDPKNSSDAKREHMNDLMVLRVFEFSCKGGRIESLVLM